MSTGRSYLPADVTQEPAIGVGGKGSRAESAEPQRRKNRKVSAAATEQDVGTTTDAALIDLLFSLRTLRSLRETSSVGASIADTVALLSSVCVTSVTCTDFQINYSKTNIF
jgi:hypothetical protein